MDAEGKWTSHSFGEGGGEEDEEYLASQYSFSEVPTAVSSTDIEVLLTNIQSLVLALRSNTKISGAGRLVGGAIARVHPLLANLLTLQRELWHWLPHLHLQPIQQSPRVDAFQHFLDVVGNSLSAPSSRAPGGVGQPYGLGSITEWVQTNTASGWNTRQVQVSPASTPTPSGSAVQLSERQILMPFCAICRSPEAGETGSTVALSSLIAIIEARCDFLTANGLAAAIMSTLAIQYAESPTGSPSSDRSTRELLLSRIAAVHVACLQHPAGSALPETLYVMAARSIVLISIQPLGSPLLKRVTEAALKNIVTTLYERVVRRHSSGSGEGETNTAVPETACIPGSSLVCETLDGAVMMRFISNLIMGGTMPGVEASLRLGPSASMSSVSSPKAHNRSVSFSDASSLDNVAAMQLEGLCLAQQALLCVLPKLRDTAFRPLLRSVQSHLCRALLVSGVHSKQSMVLSLITRTIHLLTHAAAEYLVPQIYSFLRVLHLNPLSAAAEEMQRCAGMAGSPVSQSNMLRAMTEIHERREILLESLAYLCAQGYFCRFCYTNYDLSSRYAAILPTLCDVLLYQACGRLDRMDGGAGNPLGGGGSANGGASVGGGNSPPPTGVPLADTHLLAMQAAVNLIMTLNEVYQCRCPALASCPSPSSPSPVSARAVTAGISDVVSSKEMELAIQRTVAQKNLLVEFCTFFAESPMKKGIPFLREKAVRVRRGEEECCSLGRTDCWLVLADPAGGREVGECLYRLSSLLDKRILGEYIGEQGDFNTIRPEEGIMVMLPDGREVSAAELWDAQREEASQKMGTASFFDAQLRGFISQFDFKGRSLLHAIRELVYRVCLPGESQKIDRIMEVFSLSWYESNPPSVDPKINPFTSDSTAFVLSFAIIMLNTDLHSGKMNQSMSFGDFHRMSRQADEGQDIPEAYLREVYDDVKAHEIIMADMMDKGFTNDVTWNLEMGESLTMSVVTQQSSTQSSTGGMPAVDRPRSKRAPRLCFWDVLENSRGTHTNTASAEKSNLSPSHSGGVVAGLPRTPTSSKSQSKGVHWRTLVELDPAAQQLLSRYVFASVWKRALLLFTGMIRQMSQQLSTVPAVGDSIEESTAYVSQIAPVELSALLTGLRGLTAMVVVARRLAVPEVVDYSYSCLLTTLNGKAPNTFPLDLVTLSKDLPRMLCAREVFALLPLVASSLSESWHAYAQVVTSLFAMGAFALTPAEEAQTNAEPATLARALPEALQRHPLVRLSEDGANTGASASTNGSESNSGGWFSSLLSLANTGKRSRDVEQQQQAVVSLRGCVPNIHNFLDITSRVPPAAHQLLVRAICETSTAKFKTPADMRTFSYIFSLICAMIADRSRTSPAALHTLPLIAAAPLTELYGMVEKKLPMDESGLQTAIEMSEPGTHTPLDSPVLWLRVLRRVVDGVLSVLAIAMRYRGATDVELLQQLIHLLTGAPKRVFGPIVLSSLVNTVTTLVEEEETCLAANHHPRPAPSSSTGVAPSTTTSAPPPCPSPDMEEFNAGLRVLVLTYQRLSWERDTKLLERYEALIYHMAARERYHSRQQVEELLEVAFAIGLMREKASRRQREHTSAAATSTHSSSRRSGNGSGRGGDERRREGERVAGAGAGETTAPSATAALVCCCRSTLRRLFADLHGEDGEMGASALSSMSPAFLSPPPVLCASSRSLTPRPEDVSVVKYRQHLWLLCLKALGALAMRQSAPGGAAADAAVSGGCGGSGAGPRQPSNDDAMWGLECCVMEAMPVLTGSMPLLLMLYKELLFPFAETLAVSGGEVDAAAVGQHDAPVATSTSLSEAEVIIDRCFYNYWADTLQPPERTKCCLIRLLPQPILRCSASSISTSHPLFFDVWKQLLSVLLQYHNAYMQRTPGGVPPPDSQVMECVQETLKNMIRAGLVSTLYFRSPAGVTVAVPTSAITPLTHANAVDGNGEAEKQTAISLTEPEGFAATPATVRVDSSAANGTETCETPPTASLAAPPSPPPTATAEEQVPPQEAPPPSPCGFLNQRQEYWTITTEILRMFSFTSEILSEVEQVIGNQNGLIK